MSVFSNLHKKCLYLKFLKQIRANFFSPFHYRTRTSLAIVLLLFGFSHFVSISQQFGTTSNYQAHCRMHLYTLFDLFTAPTSTALVAIHYLLVASLSLSTLPVAQAQTTTPSWTSTPFNPPAYPLAVRSPYLSCWLLSGPGKALNEDWPRFWTGSVCFLSRERVNWKG
jgi:hypothetical protein